MTRCVLLLAMLLALAWGAFCPLRAEENTDNPEAEQAQDDPGKPFGEPEEREDAISGSITLSDDNKFAGQIYLTREGKLNFYHRDAKKLLQFDLAEISWIECRVLSERMEREWRWKENANDEKVYTGRTYPVRELETVLHLADGRELVGDCSALLFLRTDEGVTRYIIHKRQKGEVGQTLEDLIYVKLVNFRPPAEKTAPEEEKKQ